LIIAGLVLILIGGLNYLFARVGINLIPLPEDIRIESGNVTCGLAIEKAILIFILLAVLLNIVARSPCGQ
jgi:hypothetical protein